MKHLHVAAVFLILLSVQLQSATCFREDPANLTVAIDTVATFSCVPSHSGPPDVAWSVFLPEKQKFFVDVDAEQKDFLVARGFNFSHSENITSMTVYASSRNNESEFRCREYAIPDTIFSYPGSLTVIGPPLPPGVMVSNPSPLEILFEWGEPFTHQDYPVDNYTVTETDAVMVETTRRTIHTLNYTKTTTAIAQGCRSMKFAIVATSSIGNSDATVIVTGFPIVPEKIFRDFKTAVRFKSSGEPEVTVTVQPPPVCEFQQAWLILELQEVDSNESLVVAMRTYSGAPLSLSFLITEGLVANTNYTIVVVVATVAGNVSDENQFHTVFIPPDSKNDKDSLTLGLIVALVGGVAGGVVLVVLVAIVVAACFCVGLNYQTTKVLRASGGVAEMQDCTYETIDDFQIMHGLASKNQYQAPYPPRPRSESPYQPMKAAENGNDASAALKDPLTSPHYISAPCGPMPVQHVDTLDSHTGQPGPVTFLRRGSGNASAEDAYIAMDGVLPVQRLSGISSSSQSNSDYRVSIC